MSPATLDLLSWLAFGLTGVAVWAYRSHRDEIAGLAIGAASVAAWPALFLLYFAWKRAARVVAWSAAGIAIALAALSRARPELDAFTFFLTPASAALAAAMLALTFPLRHETRRSARASFELGFVAAIAVLCSAVVFPHQYVWRYWPLVLAPAIATAAVFAAASVVERRREARARKAPPRKDLELSVFFPAYDEGENIGRVVERALEVLPRAAAKFEVIVVDDASRDATPAVAAALAARHPGVVRHVRHPENRGYGGAVKTGLAAARFAHVFFSDGDGQFDLAELPDFLAPLAQGEADAVIGFRRRRRDPPLRLVNAYCWGALVRTLFGIGARDVDCAYKCLPTELVRRLDLKSEGALISTEILAKLERAGCRFAERPVTHLPRERGRATGANLRVILRAFRELFRFRRELARFRLAR